MKFDNHTPVNLSAAEKVATACKDGGCYDGVGTDRYTIYKGKNWHLIHYYSSGCEYNNKVDSDNTYKGCFATKEGLILKLLEESPSWWSDELLEEMGYTGEEG